MDIQQQYSQQQHSYYWSAKSSHTLSSTVKSATCGLLSFFALGQTSEGGVTFTISGDLNSPMATVTMSGFLTMQDVNTPALFRNEFTTTGSGIGLLDPPTTSPFLTSVTSSSSQVGSQADTALILIEDASNGGEVIALYQPHLLRYLSDGRFRINFPTAEEYPTTIDAGDIATFSGSFDLALESNFSNHFVPGVYVGLHRVPELGSNSGESVTFIVDAVPEPTTALLGCMGMLFVLRRSR